jgi:class 3 adenylate cyclase/tetratricopeptide (TPR) repeat protein
VASEHVQAPTTKEKTHLLSHTPNHLAEKILRERSSLEGERRTVTVLYADAVGFTPISEKLDAEIAYKLIKGGVAHMMDAVHQYEGTITQFRGDGVMALFGAPIAHEDSARRAVAAALEMQESLASYGQQIEDEHQVELRFRVGLHTGRVVVGKVHDNLEMDYTAHGDTANFAARMEAAAQPGTVYTSESTFQAVKDYFEFESLGEIGVKGREGPVPVYKALLQKPMRTRLEVAREHGLTPYVGRNHELNTLRNFLSRVQKDQGQVVFISGEAGIGKSRLLLEFRLSLESDEATWLEGHCISFGKNIPYLPIIDLLKNSFQIEETHTEDQIIQKIEEKTAHWNPQALETVPNLKFLLNVDPGDPSLVKLDPKIRREGTFAGLRALLHQECRDKPMIVVIEDLHWIDEQSEAALHALLDVVASIPVLLILSYRPGYSHALGDRPFYTRIVLTELPPDETVEVAKGALENAKLPAELMDLITSKGEGNPFYVEEVAKSLVEEGVVERRNGSYSLVKPLDQIRVPDTIQEVILTRIDRLELEAKEALQLASVIGREFTVRLLDRISDLESELEGALGELRSLELIFQKAYFPELSYMFKHALTHDVAYASLLREKRRVLHRIIGAAIEDLYQDRIAEHYEVLAYHYFEGHEWAKALDYLLKAGEKAVASFANKGALDYYDRALQACDEIGEPAIPTKAEITRRCGLIYFSIADYDRSLIQFNEMLSVAKSIGNRQLEGIALSLRAMVELFNHDPDTCEQTLGLALAIADEGYGDVKFFANTVMGGLLLIYNRGAESVKYFEAAKPMLSKVNVPLIRVLWKLMASRKAHWEGNFSDALDTIALWSEDDKSSVTPYVMQQWSAALSVGGMGEYEKALSMLNESLELCERLGVNPFEVRILNTIGWIYSELQDHERAMEYNIRSVEGTQQVKIPDVEVVSNARLNLAENHLALGRVDEAGTHFAAVKELTKNPSRGDEWGLDRTRQRFYHSFGEFWLTKDDSAKALEYADKSLKIALANNHMKNIAKGHRLRGEALMAQEKFEEAENEVEIALDYAHRVENPTQLWKTYVVLGDLKVAQSRGDDAHQAFSDARSVIDRVADSLQDDDLKETFLNSKEVKGLREKVEKVKAA